MENHQNGNNINSSPRNNSPQFKENTSNQAPKKIKKVIKTTSSKPKATKKIIKSTKVNTVKKVGGNQVLPAQNQNQILPSQTFQKELPIKNLEQVNEEYQLKDIINKTKTMVNYNTALSTTVVKPVIVQEVITRKPIIAPVDYKTPVNFFEGQPLSEEDLIIQNFFKNTSPMVQATSQDISNSYLFNGNNGILAQSVQYPTQQEQYYNVSHLSQSVQYPSQKQNDVQVNNVSQNSQNYLRPQVQKVQPKKINYKKYFHHNEVNSHNINTNVKAVRKQPKIQFKKVEPVKNVSKSLIVAQIENRTRKNQEIRKSLRPVEKIENITVNNMLKVTYPVLIEQKKIDEQSDEEVEDPEAKIPRDSIRFKK